LSCPCGSETSYEEHCGPVIEGTSPAETPEALMRARYTAYVKVEVDFLLASLHPDGSGGVDRDSTRAWAENSEWHGLEVLGTKHGGPEDQTGEVEFVAKYTLQGEPQRHHEKASFRRHNGKWLYLDGEDIHPPPVVGPRVRIGRNDECLCGSGKKYKKCCRAVFDSGASSPEALVRARFVAPLVGESRFLARSLHPEAVQADGEADDDPPRRIELGPCAESGDVAEMDVSLYAEDGGVPVAQRHTLKRHHGRWLFAAAR
jgi:SEC-C motif-containing protein